ncbi:MAG TPA: hypothetical protein ENN98_00440 [Desulfurivibrio alkaliphilus]|uniref:Uncharacterized protein n=1 Tax=Desulfurivibrio alkaliphilus TaxID=427923 RepID=A0A7C2X959_9BACT|nr:hypothetical protein [Desulfurivibrio alkaliphilus]
MEIAHNRAKEEQKQKKRISRSLTLIKCPHCGNDRDFLEVADNVIITTNYRQNSDGSFTQEGDESQILGEIKLYCGECNSDLSQFHSRFLEMLF